MSVAKRIDIAGTIIPFRLKTKFEKKEEAFH